MNARRADIGQGSNDHSANKIQHSHLEEMKPRDVGSAGIKSTKGDLANALSSEKDIEESR